MTVMKIITAMTSKTMMTTMTAMTAMMAMMMMAMTMTAMTMAMKRLPCPIYSLELSPAPQYLVPLFVASSYSPMLMTTKPRKTT